MAYISQYRPGSFRPDYSAFSRGVGNMAASMADAAKIEADATIRLGEQIGGAVDSVVSGYLQKEKVKDQKTSAKNFSREISRAIFPDVENLQNDSQFYAPAGPMGESGTGGSISPEIIEMYAEQNGLDPTARSLLAIGYNDGALNSFVDTFKENAPAMLMEMADGVSAGMLEREALSLREELARLNNETTRRGQDITVREGVLDRGLKRQIADARERMNREELLNDGVEMGPAEIQRQEQMGRIVSIEGPGQTPGTYRVTVETYGPENPSAEFNLGNGQLSTSPGEPGGTKISTEELLVDPESSPFLEYSGQGPKFYGVLAGGKAGVDNILGLASQPALSQSFERVKAQQRILEQDIFNYFKEKLGEDRLSNQDIERFTRLVPDLGTFSNPSSEAFKAKALYDELWNYRNELVNRVNAPPSSDDPGYLTDFRENAKKFEDEIMRIDRMIADTRGFISLFPARYLERAFDRPEEEDPNPEKNGTGKTSNGSSQGSSSTNSTGGSSASTVSTESGDGNLLVSEWWNESVPVESRTDPNKKPPTGFTRPGGNGLYTAVLADWEWNDSLGRWIPQNEILFE